MTSTHALKTWPSFFQAILAEDKLHEIRKWDREFGVGDVLLLREWDPDHQSPELEIFLAIPEEDRDDAEDPRYTGRDVFVKVTYVTPRGVFGMPDDLCVMSVRRLASTDMGRKHSSTKRMAAVDVPIVADPVTILTAGHELCTCGHSAEFHRDMGRASPLRDQCTLCDDCLIFEKRP